MSHEGVSAVSDESKGLLAEVKKGRRRKFVMIYKGPNILSLVVFKRGNVENRKKEAKQAGTGQFCHGVIEGKDQDIRFVIAREDGFDRGPVKSLTLKSFLESEAEFKCKPLFEVVDSNPLVVEDDDPLAGRFLALRSTAQTACESHPDRAPEINALCLRIGRLLDQDQADQAEPDIGALEKLLASLGAKVATAVPAAPPLPPAAPPSGTEDSAARTAKLSEALKKLKPLIDKVVNAQPQRQEELFGAVAQAAGQIKARDFDAARKSIVDLGATLQRLATEAAPAPPADGAREAFRRRQGELEPQLLAAQRAAPDQATALGNVWQYADDQAREGNLANADKALDRLADAVRKTLAAAPQELVAKGTVHAAKVMLTTWKSALAEARGEIDKLGQSIRVQLPGEDYGKVIAAAAAKLEAFADDLDRALHDAAKAAADRGPIERARQLIQDYRGRVTEDRLIKLLKRAKAEVGVEVNVEGILFRAFDQLDASLAG